MKDELKISWCCDKSLTFQLTDFFIANVDTLYISHSELQDGRAQEISQWSPRLREVLIEEIEQFLRCAKSPPTELHLAIAKTNVDIVGFMCIEIAIHPNKGYAILQDMIVKKDCRNRGIGKFMLLWLEEQLIKKGIRRIFLESGYQNEAAHKFFERQNFQHCSIIMLKNLYTQ